MKKKYFILCISFLCSVSFFAQEAQKKYINYQGLARNADNQLMANETMLIGLELTIGSPAASPSYIENHTVSTDANGVFSLKIGNGELVGGDYNNISWGEGATFVSVSINGVKVGTTEMMAVPFALSSGDAKQAASDVPYDNAVSGLPATTAQEALDALAGGGTIDTDDQSLVLTGDLLTIQDGAGSVDLSAYVDDADSDITNEIQSLSFDAGTNELSLTNGGSVIIPSGGTDADADPTNELQNLSFDSGTNELSLSDGNSVTIPTGGADADADPTNEIQTISFNAASNEISLTDGGTITIPSGGTDADADPTNELQNLSFDAGTNELSLSDGNSVTIPTGSTDADADPTNEIQDISLAGTELSISDGSTIDLGPILPSGGSDDQNLELTGDVLSIEGGTGSIDLASYRDDGDADPTNEVDVTTQSGILLGDGTDVSGLEGNADGQVPKWDAATSAWVAGADETGAGGSSLWSENGNDVYFNSGNVGIGLTSPASKLHVHTAGVASEFVLSNLFAGTSTTDGLSLGISGTSEVFGINAKILNKEVGNLELGTNGTVDMVIDRDGEIGIGVGSPAATLDIAGGQWDLNTTNGDFRIGSNARGLRIGVATGNGPGGGDVRLRAQGGTDRLFLGSGNEDVVALTPSNVRINGDVLIRNPSNGDGRIRSQGEPDNLFLGNGDKDVMRIKRDTITMSAHLDVFGEVNRPSTGTANMVPIAYGVIGLSFAGTPFVRSGSRNFDVLPTPNLIGDYYIGIEGETFNDEEYVTIITVINSDRVGEAPVIPVYETSSLFPGRMRVTLFDLDGEYVGAPFSFVVYKP